MYNEKVKKEFLFGNGYDNDTIETYSHTFKNLAPYENKLGKDLFDMNLEEVEGALHFVEYRKIDRISNLISNIKVYFRWAYKAGYGSHPESPLGLILTPEYFSKFIHNKGDFYLTRNELLNFLDGTPDHSIKACMLAVFEGIGGRGYQELSNLTTDDIFKDGDQWYVNLANELDGSIRRRHPISDELQQYLMNASETTIFRGMDNEVKYHLVESKYIFRYFISRRNAGMTKILNGNKSDAKLYETYLRHFREAFGILDKFEKFSLKELKYSGMMYYLNESLNEKEESNLVTSVEADKLNERFLLPVQKTAGKVYPVYSKIKGMIVSDFMKEVYGKEIKYDFSRSARVV